MNTQQRDTMFLALTNSLRPNKSFIGSFDDVFDVMFGPQQHDAHVVRQRHYLAAKSFKESADASDRRVLEWIKETGGRP